MNPFWRGFFTVLLYGGLGGIVLIAAMIIGLRA